MKPPFSHTSKLLIRMELIGCPEPNVTSPFYHSQPGPTPMYNIRKKYILGSSKVFPINYFQFNLFTFLFTSYICPFSLVMINVILLYDFDSLTILFYNSLIAFVILVWSLNKKNMEDQLCGQGF